MPRAVILAPTAAQAKAKYRRKHPRTAASSIKSVAQRHMNPASACLPKRSGKAPFNVHEGQSITYKGTRYKIIGCGIGATARRSIGAQEEGTYALLNEKTNRVIYVAKRVVRDIVYRRGIAGRPAARGPKTAAKRKAARAKMTPAEKAAWKRKMDRAKAAKAGR